jgi:electron transfer flavoprotein alpha subunit
MDQLIAVLGQHGVEIVYVFTHPAFAVQHHEALLAAMDHAASQYQPDLITCAASELTHDALGAAAIRLDAAAIPDAVSLHLVDGHVCAVRPVQAARMLATVRSLKDRCVVSLRRGAGSFVCPPAAPRVEWVELACEPLISKRSAVRTSESTSPQQPLDEAPIVVAAGRGVRDEQGRVLVYEFAELLGAAVGATRSAVDTGLFPPEVQIGQTGKVVSPQVYFALGISGAIQHAAGMLDSRVVVAVNKDAQAPIFELATYGIVGDLYAVLPLMIRRLKDARTQVA